MTATEENTHLCKGIARDLINLAEAGAYVCPECGDFAYYDPETESYKCDCCNDVRIVSEYPDGAEINEDFYVDEKTGDHLFLEDNCATASLLDYLSDVYDIEYRIAADRETLNSVKLCVAVGGPNIYVDTGDNLVKLYWWGDYAEAYIPYYISEQITGYFEELYNC